MLKTKEIKSVIQLSLPLIAAFLAQKGMQFIDTLMMGWLGPDALAAGALGTGVYVTILVFCMGTLSAVGVFIARAKGSHNFHDIQVNLQHGICLALLLSLPCMVIIWLSPTLLIYFGQNPTVVANTTLLLHGLVWGFPGFLLFLVFREFISAFSLTRLVMFVALISLPLTFAANYGLIYGLMGIKPFGIAGIGYAGAVIMWFMFLCLLLYGKKNPLLKNYITFHLFKFNFSKMTDMLYIGAPSGILFVLEAGMFLTVTLFMGQFGVTALAAHQIALQCVNIAYAIPVALSMVTALQVSQAIGANDILQAKHTIFHSFIVGLIISVSVAAIFIFLPDIFISLFLNSNDPHFHKIDALAKSFLMIAAFFQCFDTIQAIANGALRGLKDTFIPMVLSIGCYWIIGVSSAYYFSFHTSFGTKGIWYGLTLGLCSISIILLMRLLKKMRH